MMTMFAYLFEWIQNIAFYLILITAVLHIIPSTTYKNYIRFFTGLILILLLIQPILSLTKGDIALEQVYQNATYKQQKKEMEEATEYLKNVQLDVEDIVKNKESNIWVGEIEIGEDEGNMDEN